MRNMAMMNRIAGISVLAAVLVAIAAGVGAAQSLKPFTLATQDGERLSLESSQQYTLITFYRGDW